MVKNYEPHRDEIIRLYKDNNVEDVVRIMKERGFSASRRWYLTKFLEWNCQKTRNRKKLAKRQSKIALGKELELDATRNGSIEPRDDQVDAISGPSQALVKAPNSQPKVLRGFYFLDKCPYHLDCEEVPFLTLEDYAKHKKVQQDRNLSAFRWDQSSYESGSPESIVSLFYKYLTMMNEEGEGIDSRNLLAKINKKLDALNDTQSVLSSLDFSEVLLHSRPFFPGSVCTIKAIAAGEVTSLDAKPAFIELVSNAHRILGDDVNCYPSVIEWIYWLDLASRERRWDRWSDILAEIDLPSSHRSDYGYQSTRILKECVFKFALQEFMDGLDLTSKEIPSLKEVLELCEIYGISLDVCYLSRVFRLIERAKTQMEASEDESFPASTANTSRAPSPA